MENLDEELYFHLEDSLKVIWAKDSIKGYLNMKYQEMRFLFYLIAFEGLTYAFDILSSASTTDVLKIVIFKHHSDFCLDLNCADGSCI